MASNDYNDPIFIEKRKPKNPIRFKINLNEEQKEVKNTILDNPITLLRGMAGSGKTLLACQIALDLLFRKDIEKIVITPNKKVALAIIVFEEKNSPTLPKFFCVSYGINVLKYLFTFPNIPSLALIL